MNYSALYDKLKPYNHLSFREICEKLDKFTQQKKETLIIRLFELLDNDFYRKQSYFNFFADSTFSGAPFPCSDSRCRLKNIDNLVRFAALYADKVLVYSPVETLIDRIKGDNYSDTAEIAICITILQRLEPLVSSGIIGFTSTDICICPDCLKEITKVEENVINRFDQIRKQIELEFADTVKCRLLRDFNETAYFEIKNGDRFGLHEQVDVLIHGNNPSVTNLLSSSGNVPIQLTSEQIAQFGLGSFMVDVLTNDLFHAQLCMENTFSSYLTNRQYDIDILNSLNNSAPQVDSNKISLFHTLPILANSEISDILKVRNADGEAFVVYRDCINELLLNNPTLNNKSIHEISRDIIDPEIHKIEQTFRNNKKALIGRATRDLVLLGAGISIGLFSKIIPLDAVAIASLAGGIPTISNIFNQYSEAFRSPEINNSNYYFLWKLSAAKKTF